MVYFVYTASHMASPELALQHYQVAGILISRGIAGYSGRQVVSEGEMAWNFAIY